MSHSLSASAGARGRFALVTNAAFALLIGSTAASAGSLSDLRSRQADRPANAFGSTGMQGMHELVSERRINSTLYDVGDGKRMSVISIDPQYFVAPDGNLLPIDTAVRQANGADVAFENRTNILQSEFAQSRARVTATGGAATLSYQPDAIRFSDAQQSQIAGHARPVSARADGSRVHYDGALPNIDVRYTVGPGAVAQEFVLQRLPAPPTGMLPENAWFEIGETMMVSGGSLTSVNGDHVTDGFETQGALLLLASGQTMRLAAPFASEPIVGDPALTDAVPGSYRVEVAPNGTVTLWTRIPYAWLADPARQYPVTIDPTLDLQPDGAAGKDAQLVPIVPDNNWGTREFLTDNWGTVDARGLIEFDLTSIPAGATIDSATLTLWHHFNTEFTNIGLHANTASWNEATVTWNTAPGHDAVPVASFSPGAGNMQFEDWNVAPDVQDFVDGARSNFGWTLKSDVGNMTAYYFASDHGSYHVDPAQSPHLVVMYDGGGGGGGGDCDLTPIEAKLDDETRFTDDDEFSVLVNDVANVRNDVALLEAKADAAALALAEIRDFGEVIRMTIIEHDLAQEKEGSKLMTLTCLPEAQGGNLEYVRALVESRINAAEAAGCAGADLVQARANLETGDEAYVASQFTRACDWYAKAYHAVGVHCP